MLLSISLNIYQVHIVLTPLETFEIPRVCSFVMEILNRKCARIPDGTSFLWPYLTFSSYDDIHSRHVGKSYCIGCNNKEYVRFGIKSTNFRVTIVDSCAIYKVNIIVACISTMKPLSSMVLKSH